MPPGLYSPEEVVRLGEEIYQQGLRQAVEPRYEGQYLVLDVETGEYDIDPDQVSAVLRASARHPSGNHYLLQIGRPQAFRLGRRSRIER